jgi:GTP-binding protein HflX
LELDTIPCLKVFNKIDQLPADEVQKFSHLQDGVGISAIDASTLDILLLRVEQELRLIVGKELQTSWETKHEEERKEE